MKKLTALQTINELPREFNLEELLERLVFMEKVEKGMAQMDSGKISAHSKVVERFRKRWAK